MARKGQLKLNRISLDKTETDSKKQPFTRRKIKLTVQDKQLIKMDIISYKTMKKMNREICKGDFCNYIMFQAKK